MDLLILTTLYPQLLRLQRLPLLTLVSPSTLINALVIGLASELQQLCFVSGSSCCLS